jgi:Predicted membrane protein
MSAQHSEHSAASQIRQFKAAELVLREDILAKTKELADLLADSDEVHTYREAERKIKENERIQSMIAAIKKKQKEIVGFKYFENQQMVEKIEKEIEELQDELDSIPLVQQFQQTQSDINYMLQLVVTVIRESLAEKINMDSDGVPAPADCSGD